MARAKAIRKLIGLITLVDDSDGVGRAFQFRSRTLPVRC